MRAWWGLFAKSYWNQAIMKDGRVIIPKLEGDQIRNEDTEIKVFHFAGGANAKKMNYYTYVNDDVATYLDSLITA